MKGRALGVVFYDFISIFESLSPLYSAYGPNLSWLRLYIVDKECRECVIDGGGLR